MMKTFKMLSALALIAAVGACGTPDLATRQATLSPSVPGSAIPEQALMPRYDVREISVAVPQSLRVSEAHAYFPTADIVWRGEPLGDRHAQVKAIVEEGFARGTERMTTGPAVTVEAVVTRFHALTEKARYSVGGTHAINYTLTLRDATSGSVLDGPRQVQINIRAAGGQRAIEEDRRGRTQRVVIVEELAGSILRELSAPAPLPRDVPVTRIDQDLTRSLAAVSMKNELAAARRIGPSLP